MPFNRVNDHYMKKVSSANFLEASCARDHFLGLIYRLLREGQIIHSQTYYYPAGFNWVEYLEVSIDPELELEMDENLLQMGAALTAVNWIENSYSQENFGEHYQHIVERLTASACGKLIEFKSFLNAISRVDNLAEIEAAMNDVFNVHVKGWWVSQSIHAN